MRKFVSVSGIVSALVIMGSTSAFAQSQTSWQDHQGMISTRIIAASSDVANAFPAVIGAPDESQTLLAWEATLAEGWKTYWRSPGEAGLPVRVFHNDAELDILYPFPERFELFGLETFGYSKQVAIPFRIPVKTGKVELKADFMVCKDICVPFEASYQLTLGEGEVGTIVTDTRVRNSLKTVPNRFGQAPDGIAITSVKYAGMPGHQNLVVEASADTPLSQADLLAELDETTQFHSPKTRLLADGRSIRFVLPVMSTQKGLNLAGKKVRLTLSDGRGNAIDRFFELPSQ